MITRTETTLHTEDTQNRQLQTAQQKLIFKTPNAILPQLRKYTAQKTNRRLTQDNPPS